MTSDAWYPKSSASITSITGQTTLVRFCAIRANRGSIQPSVASQWESKKVRTSPREISAPRNRARTSPSRLGIRRIFTFSNCRTCSSKGFLRFSVDYEISQNPIYHYNMTAIVRALWLAADRAIFSCNDWSLWKFFTARRVFWAVNKRYVLEGENNKKNAEENNYLFNDWKKN